jgi:hypothetical protein
MGGAHRSSRARYSANWSNLSKSTDIKSLRKVTSMRYVDNSEQLSKSDSNIMVSANQRNTRGLNNSYPGNHYVARGNKVPGRSSKTSFMTSSFNSSFENLPSCMASLVSICEVYDNADKFSNSLPNVRSKGFGNKGTESRTRSSAPTSDRTATLNINSEKIFNQSGSNRSDTSGNLVPCLKRSELK